jgi:hypothetical protein
MATRSIALTAVRGGINRQRYKTGASPDSLFDLINGYVTTDKTVVARPGTIRVGTFEYDTSIVSTSKGLCSFDSSLHVFSHQSEVVPDGVTLHIITHPDSPDSHGDSIHIREIHFAAPFMGFLYVVAEFEDESVYHYWLQTGNAWEAATVYQPGDLVHPTVANGLVYQASRASAANPSWQANAQRTIGDIVEPTTYNGFEYTVVDTQGTNPQSGDTEPDWPAVDGQQITEDAGSVTATTSTPTVTAAPDTSSTPATVTTARYARTIGGVKA